MERKVILYIAMSLDGYIASTGDDISFLDLVNEPGEDYGYNAFYETVDTIIIGRKTYDKVLSFGIPFPHANKKTFVITHTAKDNENNITFYSASLQTLIKSLKTEDGNNIFIDGGAAIANEFMKLESIDEYIISIVPILLGEGISLFQTGRPKNNLKLLECKQFKSGLVQLHYVKA